MTERRKRKRRSDKSMARSSRKDEDRAIDILCDVFDMNKSALKSNISRRTEVNGYIIKAQFPWDHYLDIAREYENAEKNFTTRKRKRRRKHKRALGVRDTVNNATSPPDWDEVISMGPDPKNPLRKRKRRRRKGREG